METKQQEYLRFKGWVASQRILGASCHWKFFEWGPANTAPLILLHGTSGTAEVFYRQFISLCPKGYRLVSVQIPPFDDYDELLTGLDEFFNSLKNSKKIHLMGTTLGGYLAQSYCQQFPSRVESLILCNSFCNVESSMGIWKWTPSFVLQQKLVNKLPTGEVESRIADAIDFVVDHLKLLEQDELASRLILTNTPSSFNPHTFRQSFDQSKITIMDSLDHSSLPTAVCENVYKQYPNAHQAIIKTGGEFPYLSRAEEVNMHIEVHLRRLNYYRPGVSDYVDKEKPKDAPVSS